MSSKCWNLTCFLFICACFLQFELKASYASSVGLNPESGESMEDDPVEMMTTLEPIDSLGEDSCIKYENCQSCVKKNCSWIQCFHTEFSCSVGPVEMCPDVSCDDPGTTTIAPNDTTTITPNGTVPTTIPTTEVPSTKNPTSTPSTTDVPTTEAPSTLPPTTLPPTTLPPTTEKPTTVAPTTPEPTTVAPTDVPTTEAPTTVTPTTAKPTEAPHTRHFDGASFVGGMILALILTGLSFAGWKFYRRRSLAANYSNF